MSGCARICVKISEPCSCVRETLDRRAPDRLTLRRLADRYRPPAADDPMVTDSGGGENPWLPQDRKLHALMMFCCPLAPFDSQRLDFVGYVPGGGQAAAAPPPAPTVTFPLRQKCVDDFDYLPPDRNVFFYLLLIRRLRDYYLCNGVCAGLRTAKEISRASSRRSTSLRKVWQPPTWPWGQTQPASSE